MWRVILGALAFALLLPVGPGSAQDEARLGLEMAHKRTRYVVHPPVDTERMIREAATAAAELEAARREAELLRDVRRPGPEVRPDLTYDVRQAIQQRRLQRVRRP